MVNTYGSGSWLRSKICVQVGLCIPNNNNCYSNAKQVIDCEADVPQTTQHYYTFESTNNISTVCVGWMNTTTNHSESMALFPWLCFSVLPLRKRLQKNLCEKKVAV